MIGTTASESTQLYTTTTLSAGIPFSSTKVRLMSSDMAIILSVLLKVTRATHEPIFQSRPPFFAKPVPFNVSGNRSWALYTTGHFLNSRTMGNFNPWIGGVLSMNATSYLSQSRWCRYTSSQKQYLNARSRGFLPSPYMRNLFTTILSSQCTSLRFHSTPSRTFRVGVGT